MYKKITQTIPAPLKTHLIKLNNYRQIVQLIIKGYFSNITSDPIIILGNQKSGTSVIAALLGHATGLSVTIDLKREYLSTGNIYKKVFHGELPFSIIINRNRADFSKDIIKEPNLTIFYPDLKKTFKTAKFIFIIRQPHQNIRSILNRFGLPGNLDHLEPHHLRLIKKSWDIVFNGEWIGLRGRNHIEMLALRWNYLVNIYLKNKDSFILMRYEDFLQDKIKSIYS